MHSKRKMKIKLVYVFTRTNLLMQKPRDSCINHKPTFLNIELQWRKLEDIELFHPRETYSFPHIDLHPINRGGSINNRCHQPANEDNFVSFKMLGRKKYFRRGTKFTTYSFCHQNIDIRHDQRLTG